MFFAVKDFSNAPDVHSHRSVFSTFLPFVNKIHEYKIALNALLKGIKHDTSNSCRAWDVWLGKEMISKLEFMATVTTSKVTCELYPYKISNYLFVLVIFVVSFKMRI